MNFQPPEYDDPRDDEDKAVDALVNLAERRCGAEVGRHEGRPAWLKLNRLGLYALSAAIASEWVSVEVRMPETDDEVLVFTAQGVALDRWRMQSEAPLSFSSATIETGMYWDEHEFEEVTHWMPLPMPPAELARAADAGKREDGNG